MARKPRPDEPEIPDDVLERMKDSIAKTFGSMGVEKIVYDDGEELLDVKKHNAKKAKGMKTLKLTLKVKIADPQKLRDYLDELIDDAAGWEECDYCGWSQYSGVGHSEGCPVLLIEGIRKAIEGKG